MPISRKDIRKIGFYDCIERDERSFHVQTEVVGEDTAKIWTQILEEGTIIDTIVQAYGQAGDDIDNLKQAAESQHNMTVTNVRSGKFS